MSLRCGCRHRQRRIFVSTAAVSVYVRGMRKWFVLLAALAWSIVTARRRRDRREYASHRVPPAALPKRPVGERRAALRLIVYIGIPLLGLLASILAGERLLTIKLSPDERGRDYALGFNVDGGATLNGYASLLRSLALANVKYREQPLEESAATQITVAARHCDQIVTVYGTIQLDARWLAAVRATRLHQPLVVHSSPLPHGQTFVIKSPNVGGRFAFAVTGAVSNFTAQLVTERITTAMTTPTSSRRGGTPPPRPEREVMPTAATGRRVQELIDRLAREKEARFDRAIGNPLQEAINVIESIEDARECIRRAAAVAHTAFPQYEGHWIGEEWQVGVIGSRVRTKLGTAFEAGDVVLFKREGYGNTETTAYSIRNGVDTAVDVYVRPRIGEQ